MEECESEPLSASFIFFVSDPENNIEDEETK